MVSVTRSIGMGEVDVIGFNPSLSCVFCKSYLFNQPRQLPCGDRICGDCFQKLQGSDVSSSKQVSAPSCPLCGGEVNVTQCFRDKAVEIELAGTVIKCTNSGCPWEGESKHFNEHHKNCKFTTVKCPNVGCEEEMYKNDLEDHLSVCKFSPVSCEWCVEKIALQDKENHLKTDCREVLIPCVNGCGEKCLRKELPQHLANTCTMQVRDCDYLEQGCQFKGNFQDLSKHDIEQTLYHLKLMSRALKKSNTELHKGVNNDIDSRIRALDTNVAAIRDDISQIRGEISQQIQPIVEAVMKSKTAIQQLHEGFTELAFMTQTMQATSYNGTFVWKINEVQRRIHAKIANPFIVSDALGMSKKMYAVPAIPTQHPHPKKFTKELQEDNATRENEVTHIIQCGQESTSLQSPDKTELVTGLSTDHSLEAQSERPNLVTCNTTLKPYCKLYLRRNPLSPAPQPAPIDSTYSHNQDSTSEPLVTPASVYTSNKSGYEVAQQETDSSSMACTMCGLPSDDILLSEKPTIKYFVKNPSLSD